MHIKYIILIGLVSLLIFSAGLVSALEVSFYYSPQCPHCQNVIPLVKQLSQKYSWHKWNFYDTTQTSYDISGIPTIRIKDICYDVEIVGDVTIQSKLECELKQQSNPNCITKPAYAKLKVGESWFK